MNRDEKDICEIFASLGKAGGCASSQLEAIGRLASLLLQSGVKIDVKEDCYICHACGYTKCK